MTPRPLPPPSIAVDDVNLVTSQLCETWITSFTLATWSERLQLLEQIDEQLRARYRDAPVARQISQEFTSQLISQVSWDPVFGRRRRVDNIDQAYFFLNSANSKDQQAARVWLILNNPESRVLDDGAVAAPDMGSGKRGTRRMTVDMSGIVAANDEAIEAKLIDISCGGAKLAVGRTLPKGMHVMLTLPFLGRVAACVVWVAAAFIGLQFITVA